MIEQGPQIAYRVSFDVAWLYCATLTHDGYTDWRIPTSEEVSGVGWIDNDVEWTLIYPDRLYGVFPVRDIND